MTSPTTAQVQALRQDCGDIHEPFLVSPVNLERLWTKAGQAGTELEATAQVYMLRAMKTRYVADLRGCEWTDSNRAYVDNLDSMIADAEEDAGMYGGAIGFGVLDLDLDADDDNLTEWNVGS